MKTRNKPSVTFTSGCKKFQISVFENYWLNYKDILVDRSMYVLNTEYRLAENLHNPVGPALINLETYHCEYFIDGKHLKPDEAAKHINYNKFYDKVDDLIEDEDD